MNTYRQERQACSVPRTGTGERVSLPATQGGVSYVLPTIEKVVRRTRVSSRMTRGVCVMRKGWSA
jgi:hypothetical protein